MKSFRVVNMHLNIGVTNPVVRKAQLQQLLEEFLLPASREAPLVLCGDTNACAEKPEPEMAWLSSQQDVPLVDCWEAVGDGTAGWTWDRKNPLTQSGPLLEPDQRVDVIYTSAAYFTPLGLGFSHVFTAKSCSFNAFC
jgi:endonuclease/exonuclease/phosphatase family metal-dependent hydrolase